MVVIPGGRTAYLEAGDIGNYNAFKDEMSKLIVSWTQSDQVKYTKAGNPKPPKGELINTWVRDA